LSIRELFIKQTVKITDMEDFGYLREELRDVKIEIGEQVIAHMNMEGIREGDYMDLEPVDVRNFRLAVTKRLDDSKCVVIGANYEVFSVFFDAGKFDGAMMRVWVRKTNDLSRNREEMDKALKFGVSKEDFDAWVDDFHKKHPKSGLYVENGQNIFYKDGEPFAVLGNDAVENLDAALKDFFRREAVPLMGDEQKEV
jgi:hypothetical protein